MAESTSGSNFRANISLGAHDPVEVGVRQDIGVGRVAVPFEVAQVVVDGVARQGGVEQDRLEVHLLGHRDGSEEPDDAGVLASEAVDVLRRRARHRPVGGSAERLQPTGKPSPHGKSKHAVGERGLAAEQAEVPALVPLQAAVARPAEPVDPSGVLPARFAREREVLDEAVMRMRGEVRVDLGRGPHRVVLTREEREPVERRPGRQELLDAGEGREQVAGIAPVHSSPGHERHVREVPQAVVDLVVDVGLRLGVHVDEHRRAVAREPASQAHDLPGEPVREDEPGESHRFRWRRRRARPRAGSALAAAGHTSAGSGRSPGAAAMPPPRAAAWSSPAGRCG